MLFDDDEPPAVQRGVRSVALPDGYGGPAEPFTADGGCGRDDVHGAVAMQSPRAAVVTPPRSRAAASAAEDGEPMQLDALIAGTAAPGRMGRQRRSGRDRRALAGASRRKRAIGDGLLPCNDNRRTTEVAIAALALDRMLRQWATRPGGPPRRSRRQNKHNVVYFFYDKVIGPVLPRWKPRCMERWGDRLRERARELGLSDAEVARRLGLAQGRYSTYVNMTREPDFATFVRLCKALQTTPDEVLGFARSKREAVANPAMARAAGVLALLDPDALSEAAELLEVIARHRAARSARPAAASSAQAAGGRTARRRGGER